MGEPPMITSLQTPPRRKDVQIPFPDLIGGQDIL